MSSQQVVKHYARLLTRWPVDRLRPEQVHFQKLLRARIAANPRNNASTPTRDETKGINSSYLLLGNTFAKQYPLSSRMMIPDSVPNHYTELEKELEEVPDRTYLANFRKRLSKMFRFK
ncbi:hypothetical protein K431DRAFT_307650 [Polychaeton citri CBS 116435]|uniref:Uncharacterized protein n=1 Tax=Polychaeton citri CBS 116435 TaxID=1314669 RepID=A0A9P4Q1Z5_9PEZI|nr:hypothetical protein K431DRAFT_307650 [Polychaeton citri CBS 116435]